MYRKREEKKRVRERERESSSTIEIINMWLCDLFTKIINIFLLWIYVGVNFFQFHDVFYSFFNSIRVNTH